MAELCDADVIIVGAGTAGLVLAEELSRNPTVRVHVIEAGKDCTDHPDVQSVSDYFKNFGTDRDWQFETVPQAGLDDRTTVQNSGKLFGGSSAINGGYYVAPSRAGIDAWANLGNSTWTYEGLKQSCLEAVQVHGPDIDICRDVLGSLTTGLEDTNGSGPVHVTADLQEHPMTKAYFGTLADLGYPCTSLVFNDSTAMGQPIYLTQDPSSMKRSDASTTFGVLLKQRSNVKILFDTAVTRLILEGEIPHVQAKGVEVASEGACRYISASKEVILSAGAFNTPKILELSGIGKSDLLQKCQIPVVIENPWVGEHLRNHVMTAVSHETNEIVPAMSVGISAMAYLSSKDQPGLIDVLRDFTLRASDDDTYDNEVRNIFLEDNEGSCIHFLGSFGSPKTVSFGIISAIPFSQGNTHITSPDFSDQPTIDPCFYSHPLDVEVMSRHLKSAASFASQPAMKPFFKLDSKGDFPGAAMINGPDLEKARKYLRENSSTTYHSSGTASMRPKEDGGVVNEQLIVHDTLNLRVVDASVIPLLPHGNPMAVVYGIAKRAAKLIQENIARTKVSE